MIYKVIKVLILLLFMLETSMADDYPLYVRFIPYTPPNLHLQTTRAGTAYYIPALTAGNPHTFTLTPTVTTPITLLQNNIPIRLMALSNVVAGCGGNKTVTVTLDYSIGGVITNIGAQTQNIFVPLVGFSVTAFNFNAISSTQDYTLNAGDFVRLTIATNSQLCLVNEFPIGGVDTDASRVLLDIRTIYTTKSAAVISDPINLLSNPKAVLGATVRYTVVVNNDAGAPAAVTNVILTDPIPAGVTYTFGDNTIVLDGVAQTDASDAPVDNTDFGVTTANTITTDLGTMNPGDTHTLTFDVILD